MKFNAVHSVLVLFLSSQLSERERSATNRIEIARGEVAMEWEDRLMEEMNRLKLELEQVHIEDRNIALAELKSEHMLDLQGIATKYKQKEEALAEEVSMNRRSNPVRSSLQFCLATFPLQLTAMRTQLDVRQEDLRDLQSKADMQLLEHRSYIERRERDHQKELDKQILDYERQLRQHTDLIGEITDSRLRCVCVCASTYGTATSAAAAAS
jgi:hypothetical protein